MLCYSMLFFLCSQDECVVVVLLLYNNFNNSNYNNNISFFLFEISFFFSSFLSFLFPLFQLWLICFLNSKCFRHFLCYSMLFYVTLTPFYFYIIHHPLDSFWGSGIEKFTNTKKNHHQIDQFVYIMLLLSLFVSFFLRMIDFFFLSLFICSFLCLFVRFFVCLFVSFFPSKNDWFFVCLLLRKIGCRRRTDLKVVGGDDGLFHFFNSCYVG